MSYVSVTFCDCTHIELDIKKWLYFWRTYSIPTIQIHFSVLYNNLHIHFFKCATFLKTQFFRNYFFFYLFQYFTAHFAINEKYQTKNNFFPFHSFFLNCYGVNTTQKFNDEQVQTNRSKLDKQIVTRNISLW